MSVSARVSASGSRPARLFGAVVVEPVRLIARNKMGLAGFIVLLAIVVVSFVGPYLVPLDPNSHLDRIYQSPSWQHWLGTDWEGRDTLAQIINGGRDVLIVAFLAGLITTLVASFFGALAAFVGGRVDAAITIATDVILTIPPIPLYLVLAATIKFSSLWVLALILGLTSWPGLLRAIRSQVLSIKEKDYIEAARLLDLGASRMVFAEILPNMLSYIAISFILAMTNAVYSQVALILFGLLPLSGHNWGVMINLAWTRGAIFYRESLSYILSPIAAIVLFQWALITFTRSLEDIFNPRLRTGD